MPERTTPENEPVMTDPTLLRRRLAAALVAALLVVPAWADDDPAGDRDDDEDAPAESEFVQYVEVDAAKLPASNTVARRIGVPAARSPFHVEQVGRRLIDEQDGRVLSDTLRDVSGVNAVPFNGTFDYFTVRGFDALSSGIVLTDGAPEPEASFHRSYNIEGVEVLKGPAGFLFGANPLAGAVNVVRKQPLPADFGAVRLSAGSWGEATGELDWNRTVGDGGASFRLNGLWTEGDGWRDRTDFEHSAVNPSFAWRPDDATLLTVNAEFATSEYGPDAGIPLLDGALPDVDRTTSYQSPFDRSEQDVTRVQVDFEKALTERVTLRNKTWYRRLEWLSEGTIFAGVFPTPPTFEPAVARLLLALDDDQTFYGNRFEVVVEAGAGAVRHRILAGLEVGRREDTYTLLGGQLPSMVVLDPVETATTRPPLFPFDFIDPSTPGAGDNAADVVAPYVLDQIAFGDRVDVLVGARYDRIDFQDDLTGADRSDSDVSPMVGLAYRPAEATSLYANAGRAFAPAGPRVPGTPDPEETEQIEVGVRQEFLGGRGRVAVAAYRLDRANIAILDDNGFSQQVGDQRSRGVEVELAFQPAPRTRALLTWAWTDAELTRFSEAVTVGFDPDTGAPIVAIVDRSGNAPAFAPEQLGSLWVAHTFPGGFEIGGGVRHVGKQFIAENNDYEIDAATTVDAMAAWTVGDWKVQVNLRNLLDEDYETRGFGSTSVTPGLPFSVTGGVTYRF